MMSSITFPLKIKQRGDAVFHLQDGLLLLIEKRPSVFILPRPLTNIPKPLDWPKIIKSLKAESSKKYYGKTTSGLISSFQQANKFEASGSVNKQTAVALNRLIDSLSEAGQLITFTVKGMVRLADGAPVIGAMVQVFGRDLRSEQELGKGQTDKQGFYQIQYSPQQFTQYKKRSTGLIVKIFAKKGKLLAVSPLLFNASSSEQIDLTISSEALQPLSLFEKINSELKPLLDDIKVTELEEDEKQKDISFLSEKTGIDINSIARFVMANRMAEQTIEAEFWFAVLGGSFYQFNKKQSLKEQLKIISVSLLSFDAIILRKALLRAFNQKEIAGALRKKEKKWIEAFLNYIAIQMVEESDEPVFVKSALEDAKIRGAKKQKKFVRLFNEHKALTPELLETLKKDKTFKKAEIADLRVSFKLSDITQGDFSVVKMIKKTFNIRQPEQVRPLAKISEEKWVKLVKEKYATGEIKLPFEVSKLTGQVQLPETEIYGKTLEREFRKSFPTTAFAGGLEWALENGGTKGLRKPKDLSKFLEAHPNFELLNTPVDNFLDNGVRPKFRKLAANKEFRLEVKATQRVFKLAPSFEATNALLADDLHSAQKIYRMGETEFIRRYEKQPGFSTKSARLTWNKAADTHAAVLTIVADLKSLEAEGLPLALRSDNNEALSNFPNWNNLFKTGDLCECEHCNSVLSPAAYFADLLMFLKDRKAKNPANTVKDILYRRRSDLGFLELNCINALTTLPYIDVVCEVLEDVIAVGENDVELIDFAVMPADPIAAKTAVETALTTQNISLGVDFSLSQVRPSDPNRWVVHGDDVTYLLKKKTAPHFFAEILRNTKASATELRAYPQYVNSKAYETLREAKYPLALPFDLFAEDVRAAFQKTNLQRWDLMRTLHGSTSPNNATEDEIAAEYFSISVDATAPFDEKRLILVADTTVSGQKIVWGETGNSWLGAVGNVKSFLQKTGLEYNELLALLDLKFINPDGDINILHLDSSCDTDKKSIQVLNASKLDRLHRFLRLWRKLKGWTFWELDLVIRHPSIGKGVLDEAFLSHLFSFSQLKNRLGKKASVEHLCALFDNLNTETRFTKLHEKRRDALYQDLFLNRRLIQPLDPAFQLDVSTDDLPTGETITLHHSVILAALGIREADLVLLKALTKASDGTTYINDDLTLANLSFIWRHAWLARILKIKIEDWKILLKIFQQDIVGFISPKAALEYIETIDHLKAADFKPDELNWLLAADRSAKAALKEADAARFLATLRKELQAIQSEYNPTQYDFVNATPPTDVDNLTLLLTTLLQKLNQNEVASQFFIATLRDEVTQTMVVTGLPSGFDFPDTISDTIRIRYHEPTTTLRFTGLMTDSEKTTLIAVTGIVAYQEAIEEIFIRPRIALKFFKPVFTAPLTHLPLEVDFKNVSDTALILKISYDPEQRLLRIVGNLSKDEKASLDTLSADVDYRNAVNSLATQPVLIAPPDERIWLLDTDLQFPLRNLEIPANDRLAENLKVAVTRAMAYLSSTLSEDAVIQQVSVQLGLTEALTRRLLTHYLVLPETLMTQLAGAFVGTIGVVDYATLKATFDGWYWANRIATIWQKMNITLAELDNIIALSAEAQLLDFLTVPLNESEAMSSIADLIRTSRLLHLRDTLPETKITLLEVLKKLSEGVYLTAADFAADVQLLNEDWLATNVEALTSSLDLNYPADYFLVENWERMRRAFYFLDNLNADINTVKIFAAAAMDDVHAKTIKELLRSKFGTKTWLTLSAEIQDVLRERKRDALAAYLLTQPKPDDAPSGKWENTNDLYAYYLLDVEMSSCQLTSRLVQASGSVQLFVQRCFMGLEPDVLVNTGGDDGDSAWRWWQWMRKYRVWEANRKVFLWPENWIEPELKKDRSPFFKDLENELLQNEINQHNVETAFTTYLEKLDNVAQLEIAGFYQEDDGDNTIVHVFGRTASAEPHLYYYRRYDYRQWTPWEKVELDIQGDYLIPAVVNKRLFLFWPIFTEVPDETENSKPVPIPDKSATKAPVKKAKKKLRLQLAVSDFRQGKWTPKKISKDFAESGSYDVEIVRKHYRFFAIDRSEIDGRFGIKYKGNSLGSDGYNKASLNGAFEISGCEGVPVRTSLFGNFQQSIRPEQDSTGYVTEYMKWVELGRRNEFGQLKPRVDAPQQDFTLENRFPTLRYIQVLMQTPWIFEMSPPWHLSYMDKLWHNGQFALGKKLSVERAPSLGSWLPFFYKDKQRTFFVLPSFQQASGRDDSLVSVGGSVRSYYPEIKKTLRELENYFEGLVQTWVNDFDLTVLTLAQRKQMEQFLKLQFPEIAPPLRNIPSSYTDKQVKNLMMRFIMRFFHYYLGALSLWFFQYRQFHFKNFYHPFVCDFAKLVYNPLKGIPALMSRETQLQDSGFSFNQSYQPTSSVVQSGTEIFYPKEVVDFSPDGAYSSYNWELFFHAPLLIANSLSKNQRFEEARDWYHFMFNPVGLESTIPGGSAMSKYWITKPFFETTDKTYNKQRIDNILRMLAGDTSGPDYSAQAKKDLEDQVIDWRTNPFEPHRIANYRTVAYQKTVVMKYLDNLIAWGDSLFRQDSMESINEATQLYVLAAEILGPRAKNIPPQAKPSMESFNELEEKFGEFSNALVEVENLMPVLPGNSSEGADQMPLPMLYFCIPQNDKMLGYWDAVADRLYKIRNCMNIEGVVRQLALFEPPIDPGALVKAVAGGVDISSALADLNAPLPLYRFNLLLQKANEICSDVKALGSALLSALEKRDGEALGLLRQAQEIQLLEAVKFIRETQIDEAKENLEATKVSKELSQIRMNYYAGQEFMNAGEIVAMGLNSASTIIDAGIALAYVLAGGLKSVPQFLIGASGFGGSPHGTAETGGKTFGSIAEDAALTLSSISRSLEKGASIASTIAGFERRQDDWDLQKDLAVKEIEQVEKTIAAAELRIIIAEKELENHITQIENAKAIDGFMRSKYTNEELYQWQLGQISGVYFQSYKLAYDLAKRAERCFRFELGLQDSSYIKFGYWDSLKKGLLSGEKLQYDLRRLEMAYLDQNRREFELTKNISLTLLDPLALIKLRETGRCFINLPEEIFDLDFPGHYFRRIKSVSLTLPCVVGPYTTISCTLRLLKNSVRINTANGDNEYPHNIDENGLPSSDDRFIENNIPVKAIAASSAQNDSGVFELSFRDERYLPFEGGGAISNWSLELFNDSSPDFGKALRQFDYGTISDVILHVKYTAREDVGPFKNGVVDHLRNYFSQEGTTNSLRMFNLRQEFSDQWYRFLNPVNPADENIFELEMSSILFPIRDKGKVLKINTIWLMARSTHSGNYDVIMSPPLPIDSDTMTLVQADQYGGLHFNQKDVSAMGVEIVPSDSPVKWQLRMTQPSDENIQVEDMLLVLGYEWE